MNYKADAVSFSAEKNNLPQVAGSLPKYSLNKELQKKQEQRKKAVHDLYVKNNPEQKKSIIPKLAIASVIVALLTKFKSKK